MLGRFLLQGKVRELVGRARQSPPLLLLDESQFRASYNAEPFVVKHRLAEHPMFQFGALATLCRRLPGDQVRFRVGVIPEDAEFNSSLSRFRGQLTLDDVLDRFEENQAYIAIYNAERDPEYGPVIDGLLGELAVQTERIEPGMSWYSTYMFITAQDSVTPYHMDREMNFLLQIRGTKTVRLWDPRDDEIMTPAERDRLLTDYEALPTYKPSFERKAMVFDLAPGLGVHHPFIAPHLVKTGKQLSISLAITFRTRQSDKWTEAHRFNHGLRQRLGVAPGAVGEREVVDATKAGLMRLSRSARRLLGTIRQSEER